MSLASSRCLTDVKHKHRKTKHRLRRATDENKNALTWLNAVTPSTLENKPALSGGLPPRLLRPSGVGCGAREDIVEVAGPHPACFALRELGTGHVRKPPKSKLSASWRRAAAAEWQTLHAGPLQHSPGRVAHRERSIISELAKSLESQCET